MLLAEALALVALDADSGRHDLGVRSNLNAALAGLLVAELVLDGHAEPGERPGTVVTIATRPAHHLLAAAYEVTAVLLSMTGPAHLLERVAPHRAGRKHARRRIDHALDEAELGPVAEAVRRVLADAQVAVIAATTAAVTAATSS